MADRLEFGFMTFLWEDDPCSDPEKKEMSDTETSSGLPSFQTCAASGTNFLTGFCRPAAGTAGCFDREKGMDPEPCGGMPAGIPSSRRIFFPDFQFCL